MSDLLTKSQAIEPEIPFELASLTNAVHYQRWVFRTVAPYVGSRVLEIGAGIGNMSKWLPIRDRLILTETDPQLMMILKKSFNDQELTSKVLLERLDVLKDDLTPYVQERLDTVVSFNVLEHIEDEELALKKLCDLVRETPGRRRVVTFVPAHAWAYGEMDRTFGHVRRYSRADFKRLCKKVAPEARLTFQYFNTVGLLGWVLNGRILRKAHIGNGSLQIFETLCPWIAPVDDFLHKVLRLPFGQSLLAVMEWE